MFGAVAFHKRGEHLDENFAQADVRRSKKNVSACGADQLCFAS
jgi:hypothetical protein